jgi:hypothetical protein
MTKPDGTLQVDSSAEIYSNKRVCERRRHTAIIEFSYFNKRHCFEGQTLNHCDDGICFKSEVALKPGATVSVRIRNFHPHGARNGDCRGLRSIALAKIKWCKEILDETEPIYEIGARYFQPPY